MCAFGKNTTSTLLRVLLLNRLMQIKTLESRKLSICLRHASAFYTFSIPFIHKHNRVNGFRCVCKSVAPLQTPDYFSNRAYSKHSHSFGKWKRAQNDVRRIRNWVKKPSENGDSQQSAEQTNLGPFYITHYDCASQSIYWIWRCWMLVRAGWLVLGRSHVFIVCDATQKIFSVFFFFFRLFRPCFVVWYNFFLLTVNFFFYFCCCSLTPIFFGLKAARIIIIFVSRIPIWKRP